MEHWKVEGGRRDPRAGRDRGLSGWRSAGRELRSRWLRERPEVSWRYFVSPAAGGQPAGARRETVQGAQRGRGHACPVQAELREDGGGTAVGDVRRRYTRSEER